MESDDGTLSAATTSPVAGLTGQSAGPTPTPGSLTTTATAAQQRMPYTPQFSATTEMILKRIRTGDPGGINAALSSASNASAFNKSMYEDAKRRLVMSMNTSMTIPFPETTPPPPVAAALLHAPSSGPTSVDSPGRPPVAAVAKPRGGAQSVQKIPAKRGRPAARGSKRKRGKDEETSSNDPSESGGDDTCQESVVLTMTKSGRQVLKPNQYNPAKEAAQAKKKHWGKRTPEQMLCKLCMRGLSPANNQIVFCDGCNSCWHQRCHEPLIDDEFVSNESRSWFCMNCVAKKEKQTPKRRQAEKPAESPKEVNWALKTKEQKRAYISSLSHGKLVNIIMQSLELHLNLPVFPTTEPAKSTKRGSNAAPAVQNPESTLYFPMSSASNQFDFTGASSSRNSNPPGVQDDGKMGSGSRDATIDREQAAREGSEDSVPPSWPKPGQGVLAGLQMNERSFEDKNDYEAFSVATYNAKGEKVVENGAPVRKDSNGGRSLL